MSEAFTVDVSQLVALGQRCATARSVVDGELLKAGHDAGLAMVAQAVQNAPSKTGFLRSHIGPADFRVSGNLMTIIVPSRAPYSLAVEKGRRAFGPVSAKFLHFFVDGHEVFTKWVKAVPAHPFLAPALRQTAAKTTAIFAAALDRATARILGGR